MPTGLMHGSSPLAVHTLCMGLGCEEPLVHLLNYVWPNIFETSPHVVQAVSGAIDGCRVAVGPSAVLSYTLQVWNVHLCCSVFVLGRARAVRLDGGRDQEPKYAAMTAHLVCVKRLGYSMGLWHPARKVREVYWRIYNSLYIGAQDALVAFLPRMEDDAHNTYQRYELDLMI
eukprot:1137868-Pelagomonas_calceolata.AAC.1